MIENSLRNKVCFWKYIKSQLIRHGIYMTKQFLCHLPSATDRRGNLTRRGPAIRWVCLLNPDIKREIGHANNKVI